MLIDLSFIILNLLLQIYTYGGEEDAVLYAFTHALLSLWKCMSDETWDRLLLMALMAVQEMEDVLEKVIRVTEVVMTVF